MKVVHIYNLHRYRGGADNATLATVELLRDNGLESRTLAYSSKDLRPDLLGKMQAFGRGIYSPSARGALRRLLDEFEPDIVHAYKLYPLISPWVLPLCRDYGIPVVMTLFDYQLTCPVGMHYWKGEICTRCVDGREYWGVIRNCRNRLAESIAYSARHAVAQRFQLYRKHVDRFITPTRFSGQWLVDHAGIAPEKVRVIPYMFDLPDRPADPGQGEYIAYSGRFAPEKGVAILADAVRQTQLPCRLAGDAATLDLLDGIPDARTVVVDTRAGINEFYRKARFLVVPSLWFETYPLVIGEAMSHGIPVVASNIAGLPEIVEDGVTGLIFEPGNARDLAAKIRMLWENPDLCRKLGQASREKIMNTCRRDLICEQILNTYQELAG